WNEVRESPDLVIAILDSGVQINHPDLRDNIWRNINEIADNGIDDDKNGFIDDINGWDFVNNTADPNPKFEDGFTEDGILHGTVVAGVAAASGNNAAGIAGVTWRAQIMALKVLNDKGEGDTNKVIKAIDYAAQNGADIINLSFVGFGFSQSLDDAIKRAYGAGIIIVAAAGNEQGEGEGYFLDEVPMYPACHDGANGENRVIGVAATDTLDQKAVFSSYGFKCVDIAAPGISIYSTVVYSPTHYVNGKSFSKYYDGYWSGTSMAAPMVSGAVALIEQANPGFNRDQVISALLNNTDNINRLNPQFINQLGRGRLNIVRAVNYAKSKLVEKTTNLLVAPYSNYASLTKITDKDGNVEQEFFAYADNFSGGATVAAGDIDGDGIEEVITGAGFGGGPHVRIFSPEGELKGQFFAYNPNFRGGVTVAAGDIDGDGIDEIITGAGFGGGPHVRIFDMYGDVKAQFFAYHPGFRGGVNVAAGDVNGDGKVEIVTGAGNTGGPQVRIFKANGQVQAQFFAYHPNFRGGVKVAVANIDGGTINQQMEIITAPGQGGGPHIRIFDNHANIRGQFFAYNKNFHGGVNLSAGDIDQDGIDEIITGAGPGGAPHVRVFETNGKLIGSFYAYEAGFDGGVNVGVIEVKK
ncbi:S8 family serine peptidase, partial [Candidatus Parcubacteria bacterium]|nr:S8 family serine peptidase [Candidatus Parcubacteria bacterium]